MSTTRSSMVSRPAQSSFLLTEKKKVVMANEQDFESLRKTVEDALNTITSIRKSMENDTGGSNNVISTADNRPSSSSTADTRSTTGSNPSDEQKRQSVIPPRLSKKLSCEDHSEKQQKRRSDMPPPISKKIAYEALPESFYHMLSNYLKSTLPLKNHFRKLKGYRNCFRGQAALDLVFLKGMAPSKEMALELLNNTLKSNAKTFLAINKTRQGKYFSIEEVYQFEKKKLPLYLESVGDDINSLRIISSALKIAVHEDIGNKDAAKAHLGLFFEANSNNRDHDISYLKRRLVEENLI